MSEEASLSEYREKKREEKSKRKGNDHEIPKPESIVTELRSNSNNGEKLKVGNKKLLLDIIKQGGDVSQLELDEKLWKPKV